MSQMMDLTLQLPVETHDRLERICSGASGWTPGELIRSAVEALQPHLSSLLDARRAQPVHVVLPALTRDRSAHAACSAEPPAQSVAWCCECGRAVSDAEAMSMPWDGRSVCFSCCDA